MIKCNVTEFGAVPDGRLQTEAFQAALDSCRESGGTVTVPSGDYTVAGLNVYSDTHVILEDGARVFGSDDYLDYGIIDPPDGVVLRNDPVMIPNYDSTPRLRYRNAIFSAYGQHNISFSGHGDALINGRDCFDPEGEEGFRGPHGIYMSCCDNVTFEGYTIADTGNFMHQLDNCHGITMRNVTALAAHDGIHIHCCRNILIEDCIFTTGDDCIAGCDVENLIVRRCKINTSCSSFRIGGVNFIISDCSFEGPGYYPHRYSVVRGKNDCLPREQGRHNTLTAFLYFSSGAHPASLPAGNWLISGCSFSGIDRIMHFENGSSFQLQSGQPLTDVLFRSCKFDRIAAGSVLIGDMQYPLTVTLSGCTLNNTANGEPLFPESENVHVRFAE